MREGWILNNPFAKGEPLISPSHERRRETIVTIEQEQRLLDACDHPQRHHLRPIMICALDTGMRQGEILKLRWNDIDLERRTINVRAFNTKTMCARRLAMTDRLLREFVRLLPADGGDPAALVLGVTNNVKRSFSAARTAAGLPSLRFHDLRHTAATRLARGHLPIAEIGRVLGHTQPRTTYRYINADDVTAQRAAEILGSLSDPARQKDTPEPAAATVN